MCWLQIFFTSGHILLPLLTKYQYSLRMAPGRLKHVGVSKVNKGVLTYIYIVHEWDFYIKKSRAISQLLLCAFTVCYRVNFTCTFFVHASSFLLFFQNVINKGYVNNPLLIKFMFTTVSSTHFILGWHKRLWWRCDACVETGRTGCTEQHRSLEKSRHVVNNATRTYSYFFYRFH